MELETGQEGIRQLAEGRDGRDWEYTTFLKHWDEDGARVHRILDEVKANDDALLEHAQPTLGRHSVSQSAPVLLP